MLNVHWQRYSFSTDKQFAEHSPQVMTFGHFFQLVGFWICWIMHRRPWNSCCRYSYGFRRTGSMGFWIYVKLFARQLALPCGIHIDVQRDNSETCRQPWIGLIPWSTRASVMKYRDISISRDCMLWMVCRFKIWHASPQHRCGYACQMSKLYDNPDLVASSICPLSCFCKRDSVSQPTGPHKYITTVVWNPLTLQWPPASGPFQFQGFVQSYKFPVLL